MCIHELCNMKLKFHYNHSNLDKRKGRKHRNQTFHHLERVVQHNHGQMPSLGFL